MRTILLTVVLLCLIPGVVAAQSEVAVGVGLWDNDRVMPRVELTIQTGAAAVEADLLLSDALVSIGTARLMVGKDFGGFLGIRMVSATSPYLIVVGPAAGAWWRRHVGPVELRVMASYFRLPQSGYWETGARVKYPAAGSWFLEAGAYVGSNAPQHIVPTFAAGMRF